MSRNEKVSRLVPQAAEFHEAIPVHHLYQSDPVQALKLKSATAKTVIDLEVEILSALDRRLFGSGPIVGNKVIS